MKLTMKLLALLFGALMLAHVANAETPRQQLQQMVEQLQRSPTDDALRERIIKRAQTLRPAPAMPEEGERRMARGAAAIKGAKSVADYQSAAKEFEQATLFAPWYGDAYFNLGVAQDKAENYEASLRSLKLALLAAPNDKEIKALIYEVEYRKDRESSPEVQAEKVKDHDKALLRSLDSARYVYRQSYQSAPGSITTYTFDIRGNEVIMGSSFSAGEYQRKNYPWEILDEPWHEDFRFSLNGHNFSSGSGRNFPSGKYTWTCKKNCPTTCTPILIGGKQEGQCPMFGVISDDGSVITFHGNGEEAIFVRER